MKSHDHQHINKDPLADSAGVPWDGRAFNENPFANDDGSARPELISAIILVNRARVHTGKLLTKVPTYPS